MALLRHAGRAAGRHDWAGYVPHGPGPGRLQVSRRYPAWHRLSMRLQLQPPTHSTNSLTTRPQELSALQRGDIHLRRNLPQRWGGCRPTAPRERQGQGHRVAAVAVPHALEYLVGGDVDEDLRPCLPPSLQAGAAAAAVNQMLRCVMAAGAGALWCRTPTAR